MARQHPITSNYLPSSETEERRDRRRLTPWGVGVGSLIAAAALLAPLYLLFLTGRLPVDIRLPLLAIAGVVTLLIALAIVAAAFNIFDLSNPKEALGLPEGSVRSVIALSLLVLFAIFAIYLYGDLNRPSTKQVSGLTQTQKDDFLKMVPNAVVIPIASEGTSDNSQRFTIFYRDVNQASEEFAKELLIMIGTLVTSVASFYFGSKAVVAPANAPVSQISVQPPSVRALSPKSIERTVPRNVEIVGDNLQQTREVKVTLGGGRRQVLASEITSSSSLVKCHLNVPADEPAGVWTLTVTSDTGQQADLPEALTVT